MSSETRQPTLNVSRALEGDTTDVKRRLVERRWTRELRREPEATDVKRRLLNGVVQAEIEVSA